MKKIILYLCFALIIIFITIFIRIFLIEIYSIPSSSMENSLMPRDKVLVSKLYYGPRMPFSVIDIPWINLFYYINNTKIDSIQFSYRRIKGFSKIKRGDIIVFNFPKEKGFFYIKRCIGLPGETILIKNAETYIDNVKISMKNNLKMKYNVWANDWSLFFSKADSLKIQDYKISNIRLKEHIEITLNEEQYNLLYNLNIIDSIKYSETESTNILQVYPNDPNFFWTLENFGPVLVPKKGMKIELNRYNYFLYKKIIENYEGAELVFRDGHAYKNNATLITYTFQQDYFFVMGDNRYNSNDSRSFGFVPEEGIVGKAVMILFADDINRIFKIL